MSAITYAESAPHLSPLVSLLYFGAIVVSAIAFAIGASREGGN